MIRNAVRAALGVAFALALAGCAGGPLGGAGGKPADAPRHVAFYRGDVVVTGPPGYCIDPASVQRGAGSGFALMASCGHLSTAPTGQVPAAVITVSVLPRNDRAQMPTARQLAGPWMNAGVTQQVDADGISLIQVERGGDSLLPAGDPRHWRAATQINGHLVGLAIYGEAGAQVSDDAGRALLTATAKAMQGASPRRERGADVPEAAPAPES